MTDIDGSHGYVRTVPGRLTNRYVPHATLVRLVALELEHDEPCRCLDAHVRQSIRRFTDLADTYPRHVAQQVIAEAITTWRSCRGFVCSA